MEHTHRFLILGNGPSLKKEFFDCFGDIPCLGMNAAYRYWHQINWYPRIYCCLDDQVVLSHADAIRDLAENQLCQIFFLHHNILSRHPELAALSNIYFLPQLCPGPKNKEICERLNIPHRPSVWFKSYQPSKLTTGAYSVRFGAHLGYKEIGLVGVDCRYVEIVQGTQLRDGIVLEVVDTPSNNKNYFFDDYQRVGDRYNLPNPVVHGGNLHLQSFEALAEDVKRFKWDLDISICTTESEIYEHDVFPYVPLYRFIARASLSAVFVPFTKRDIHLLEQHLLRWGQPEFAPFSRAPAKPTIELHFAMNAAVDKGAEACLKDAFRKARLDRFFTGPSFHYSDLSGLDDQYTRVSEGDVGPAGYMAGPNNQFFDIIRKFAKGMSHILLMEPDAVPIRANWLKAAEDIVRGPERFWICGSQYRGDAMITSLNHINGNAIYNVGDTDFRTFFENVFLPYFYCRVKDNPSICYDIVLYDMFAKAYTHKPSEEVVSLWKETAHLFRFSEWIVDVSHAKDREAHVLMSTLAAQKRYPNSYILHGAVENLFRNGPSLGPVTDASLSSAISAESPGTPVEGQVHIISLSPGLIDSYGHWLAYDTQLRLVCTQLGVEFISAANAQLDSGLMELHPYVRAVFTDSSSKSGRAKGHIEPPAPVVERFRSELENFVDEYLRTCAPEDKVILYFYTGGLPHVEAIYDIVKARPRVSAHMNLFWCSFTPIRNEAFRERWAETLRMVLLEDRLVLTVPTLKMQREIREAARVVLPVAPMPSTTFDDAEARNVLEQSELRLLDNTKSANCNVVFPSLMREVKGYALSVAVIRMLSKKQTDTCYQCTLRYIPREETPLELLNIAQGARGFANIVEGVLHPEEFKRMIKEADIIVLPYQPSEFSNRTSGLLIDALVCGVPLVVQKGTWLGDIVARYGGGALAKKASPKAYIKAIELVAANYHKYRKDAISAGKKWLDDNNWETMLNFILEPPPPLDTSNCVLGPFRRDAHAHINENALVATLLVDQTKTGVMIDVGALHGSTLAPFCRRGWRVFAFEPDPTNREELETHFGHNANLTIDGRAVADRVVESMPFYSSAESPGISSLHPFNKSHKEACTVSTTTIADFVREKDVHHIDYLKIDAEGYDLLVLKGVPWDSIKPNVIIAEFEDSKTKPLGYTMHDMARYLTERGYTVLVSEWHPIIRYGVKHDWHRLAPYPCELHDPNAWGNLIALRDQPDLKKIAAIARHVVTVDKIDWRGGMRMTSLIGRGLYLRLVGYLKTHYPMIITLGRLAKWGLTTLKSTFFGIGGIAVLVTLGLYIAGALIEPARWYLVGIASALLLLGGGLLALFYARFILNRFASDQRTQVSDVRRQVSDVRRQMSGIKKEVSALNKEISGSKNTLAKMNVGNFPFFQPFNRQLTNEDLKRFAVEWVPKLGLSLDSRALGYIAHRICLAEDTCIGRLAGNIETMLLRVLVARSVKEPNLEVLEIGTMFGVGVAMIYENCRGFFDNVHVTVVDPLSGYYGSDNLDAMTRIPVTRDIFVHNMRRMNIPESDYTIIEKLSTEDEALEQASKRGYNLLIIDGDHSYSGVKHDFYNYRHLVKRGGYIIFDDYNNPVWPEVKDFVDKEVVVLPELEFVGTDVYSAVFRVIAPQDLKKRGRKQHK